jgi:hypothetical protein
MTDEKRLVRSEAEINDDVLFIHSDVYQAKDGWFYWVVDHPGSGWSASGRTATVKTAYQAITKAVTAATDMEVTGGATVLRVHRDMP